MIPELRDLSYEEQLKECGLSTIETTERMRFIYHRDKAVKI